MARRNTLERLQKTIEEDVRLCTLPGGAQWLWIKLMQKAEAACDGGYLRYGPQVGFQFGFLASVSLSVNLMESEVKTGLETLQARNLVQILPEQNALFVPHAKAGAERTKSATANGLRGGRPRKGETPEQAHARRQGTFMLPIPGGNAETEKTGLKPNSESSCAVPTTTPISDSGGGGIAHEPPKSVSDPAVALAKELAALAGIELRAVMRDAELVTQWLAQGASPELLRQVVRTVSARQSYTPQSLNGRLGYFARPLEDALQQQAASQPQPTPGPSWVETAAAAEEAPPTPCHEPTAAEAWQHIHTRLQTRLGAEYRQLRGLALVSVRDGEAVVRMPTPSRFERDRARESHGHVLVRLLQEAGLEVSTVQWQAAAQEAA